MEEYKFNRAEEGRKIRQMMAGYHANEKEQTREAFQKKKGLKEAIEAEVLPALVSIKTRFGIIGMGFFQHSEWLVSNAHILSCQEALEGVHFTDHQSNKDLPYVETSYHRPPDENTAPDTVIVRSKRQTGNNRCLATRFLTDDVESSGRYFFYISFNADGPKPYELKFLHDRTQPGSYPLIYQCDDGSMPQHGSSGTPIIEARVIIGREPKWQFRVAGVLYARCASNWYQTHRPSANPIPKDTKLVCAIPIIQEFDQILEILRAQEAAIREEQMAVASEHIGDEKGKKDAAMYHQRSLERELFAKYKLIQFESGVTHLNIALPPGLDKLWYKGVVNIQCSLLLEDVRRKVLGRKAAKKFEHTIFGGANINIADLKQDFDLFIAGITASGNIKLQRGNNVDRSPAGYFRIDIGGGSNKNPWILDIQDNTGKTKKGKPLSHNGTPLSSVFAKVILPNTTSEIAGTDLADLFNKSQATETPINVQPPKKTASTKSRRSNRR